MSSEKEQNLNPEKKRLEELAKELDIIQMQKTGGKGDNIMQKLIKRLGSGDVNSAKVFLGNEADKFAEYREDAIPLIIEKPYGDTESPWFITEREMKSAKRPESQ